MRTARRCGALVLAGLVALPTPARAGGPRAAEVPLAVEVPERSQPDSSGMSKSAGDEGADADPPQDSWDMSEESGANSQAAPRAEGPAPPPPRSLAPGAALARGDEPVAVAVGLGPSAPGTREELQLVDALERAARASASPTTSVRRLRAGTGEARQVCRERRDDLVIQVEYLPDRGDPVLLAHDCRLDRALGVRGADAASHPELVAALWAEHEELVRQGVKERRRGRLGPKVRTGLIVGGAIVAVGVAVGFIVAASLRREIVVLTVRP